jgi:hypothetical protein
MSRLAPELAELIGERAYVRLAEEFGGTRLYVPATIGPDHDIAKVVGLSAARILSERLGGAATIRVPLAREARARQYRAAGWSNAKIARALGITETGVDKLFGRMPDAPAKGSNQLDLFA